MKKKSDRVILEKSILTRYLSCVLYLNNDKFCNVQDCEDLCNIILQASCANKINIYFSDHCDNGKDTECKYSANTRLSLLVPYHKVGTMMFELNSTNYSNVHIFDLFGLYKTAKGISPLKGGHEWPAFMLFMRDDYCDNTVGVSRCIKLILNVIDLFRERIGIVGGFVECEPVSASQAGIIYHTSTPSEQFEFYCEQRRWEQASESRMWRIRRLRPWNYFSKRHIERLGGDRFICEMRDAFRAIRTREGLSPEPTEDEHASLTESLRKMGVELGAIDTKPVEFDDICTRYSNGDVLVCLAHNPLQMTSLKFPRTEMATWLHRRISSADLYI